jgi:hypothetical protein
MLSVVAVVVAVGGLSPVAWLTAAPLVVGSLPVSSSFRIRLFKSSSSSQTVLGAVVDAVDSVDSVGTPIGCASAARGAIGLEAYIRGVEYCERFDCLYAWPRMCDPASGMLPRLPEWLPTSLIWSDLELYILGVVGGDLELGEWYLPLLRSSGLPVGWLVARLWLERGGYLFLSSLN